MYTSDASFTDEAHFIIEQLSLIMDHLSATNQKALNLDNVAILYRSKAQSRILETKLMKNNITYRLSGHTSFWERTEIADLVCIIYPVFL